MYPEPQEIKEISTARNGRVKFVYELFSEPEKPNRFQIWKGKRCLLEIFDDSNQLSISLPLLISEALVLKPNQPNVVRSLSGIEKFICFVLGRNATWAGDAQNIPELTGLIKNNFVIGSRHADWRLIRLKGWTNPKIMLLVRTWAGGKTFMGSNSSTTIHHFKMEIHEAEKLREGMMMFRRQFESAFPT